jgi:hypothetical protein
MQRDALEALRRRAQQMNGNPQQHPPASLRSTLAITAVMVGMSLAMALTALLVG